MLARPFRPLLALALGALGAAATAATLPANSNCAEIPGTAQLLRAGSTVLVGEVHGTSEMPAAFLRLVCSALRRGQGVAAGLEIHDADGALDAYMASDDEPAARLALLASPFWSRTRDGRSSAAWLDTIVAFKALRHAGLPLTVFALYDKPGLSDQAMAQRLRRERLARPDDLIVTLSGNIHSMLQRGSLPAQIPEPLGALVADLNPVSINLTSDGGQSWSCRAPGECHVFDDPQPPVQNGPLLAARPASKAGVYSLDVNVGRTTASPPAAQAVR